MNLQERIDLLTRLGEYMLGDHDDWQQAKERASRENGWFTPEFVSLAIDNIAHSFLQDSLLTGWAEHYQLHQSPTSPSVVGIVMAGNIPLVGFHDLLCVFISGHIAQVKASSKDSVLIKHIVSVMSDWNPAVNEAIVFSTMLKGCDAYIATGSNNTAGYFQYYFAKYPNIIRKNRTSVAVLTGDESSEDLHKLADDVYQYFGLGCRNVTKLYVPTGYDFVPIIESFKRYNYLAEHHKYKNNYDYNLAIRLLNKKYFMSNESLLLVEETGVFSPISQLHFEYYSDKEILGQSLKKSEELQCIIGKDFSPFGTAQQPSLYSYADGIDTLLFLKNL